MASVASHTAGVELGDVLRVVVADVVHQQVDAAFVARDVREDVGDLAPPRPRRPPAPARVARWRRSPARASVRRLRSRDTESRRRSRGRASAMHRCRPSRRAPPVTTATRRVGCSLMAGCAPRARTSRPRPARRPACESPAGRAAPGAAAPSSIAAVSSAIVSISWKRAALGEFGDAGRHAVVVHGVADRVGGGRRGEVVVEIDVHDHGLRASAARARGCRRCSRPEGPAGPSFRSSRPRRADQAQAGLRATQTCSCAVASANGVRVEIAEAGLDDEPGLVEQAPRLRRARAS